MDSPLPGLGPASGEPDRPPLREPDLRRALIVPDGLVTDIRVVARTGSTNADVRDLALSGAPEGTVLVAEQQVLGRGRLDRTWVSPARAGLTFSVLLRPDDVPPRRWTWLPLLTGCAVADGIAAVTGVEPRLKWPNDVLLPVPGTDGGTGDGPGDGSGGETWDGGAGEIAGTADDEGSRDASGNRPRLRKACGILLERVETTRAGRPSGPGAVLGVGLNVSNRRSELPAGGGTSLAGAGATMLDRGVLLGSILGALASRYQAWVAATGDPERGLWNAYRGRCDTLGRPVRVQSGPDTWVEGVATDVDADGRLVLSTVDGVQAFSAGDVIHVRRGRE